jgi:hypothetical protein
MIFEEILLDQSTTSRSLWVTSYLIWNKKNVGHFEKISWCWKMIFVLRLYWNKITTFLFLILAKKSSYLSFLSQSILAKCPPIYAAENWSKTKKFLFLFVLNFKAENHVTWHDANDLNSFNVLCTVIHINYYDSWFLASI